MDDEIKNFIKVWITVYTSLIYCYFIPLNLPNGKFRFISLLPIFYLFTTLPLQLNTISLGGTTAFFLTWLGSFKLLLFSFGQGPLTSDPSISLSNFISIACLPIKFKQNPHPQSSSPKTQTHSSSSNSKSPLSFIIKALVLALLSTVYEHRAKIHSKIMLVYFCVYLYIGLELILAVVAAMAASILGFELEPQFDEPYLATSLQDFWGRRWNLMVSNILRPTVYVPIRRIFKRIISRELSQLVAVLATFIGSGLMHEVIFYYLGRVSPTWEVTAFFVLHGVCVAVEILVKRVVKDRWRLHPVVSGPLAIGFVMVTGFWLFFPPLLRCETDVRTSREIAVLLEFMKGIGLAIMKSSTQTSIAVTSSA